MLPEIAAEALRFLPRRDLDRACAVSKWLDALIAQCCAAYPLRPVFEVVLRPWSEEFGLDFRGDDRNDSMESFAFINMDEAVHFAGSILRNSYVKNLQLGAYPYIMSLSPGHWKTLVEAMCTGAIHSLAFSSTDFSALNNDTFLVALRCRGLRALSVERSVVHSSFVTDNLLRSSVPKGLLTVWFSKNKSDTPHPLSEDAVIDFFFSADTASARQHRYLNLENFGATDRFLINFFERLQTSSVRPSGDLWLYGAAKQRGLSAYAHYLVPGGVTHQHSYRFPSNVDNNKPYEIEFSERATHMYMRFGHVDRPS